MCLVSLALGLVLLPRTLMWIRDEWIATFTVKYILLYFIIPMSNLFLGQIYLSVRNTSNTEASLVKTGQRIAQITFVVTPLFAACESVLIPQARLVDLYKTRSPASNSGCIARFIHGSVFESRLLNQTSTEWSAWFSPKMKDNTTIEGWLVRQKRGKKVRTLVNYIRSLFDKTSNDEPACTTHRVHYVHDEEDECELLSRGMDNLGFGSSGV